MPNIRSSSEVPKGHHYELEKSIQYKFPLHTDIESPPNTISLIGSTSDKSRIYFLLYNMNEELLSLLRVVKIRVCGKEYYQILKIGSKIKKRGYAKYLYNLALRNCDLPLISDTYLTRPGSFNIWESLILYRTISPYKIYYLNSDDCSINDYDSKKPDTFYWGFDQDCLEEFINDPDNLDYQLNFKDIDEATYDFFKSNLTSIKDRTNIRLIISYNGS